MKRYIKNDEIKYLNKIVIYKNGQQILNPTEDMLLEDGWVEYVPEIHEPTQKELLIKALNNLIYEIEMFDQSINVNSFYIGNTQIWLDKATRVGLMLRFQSEKSIGRETTSLWYNDIKYDLNIDNALDMLTAIEIYASACYDNTKFHRSQVKNLETIDEINNYDYKTGYPEKLRF